MRVPALLLALSLAGCSAAQTSAVPAPPPSVPPAPSSTPPPAPTTTRPAAPVKEVPAAPAPPMKEVPATSPPPPPPAVLSPSASPEAERRLSATAQSRIDGAEQLVRALEPKPMAADQQESFATIQSFLVKAREAMSAKDFQRAFTLADKAHQLAEDLNRRVR